MGHPLSGKRVLINVTGNIAAYKSAELVRLLVKTGCQVQVCMTRAATEFITPLTLETLSGNPVITEIFDLRDDSTIGHTEVGRHADLAVIAPTTADFLGRLAGGLANDALLNTLMASTMPVLLCPSMNVNMWENPLVQRNVTLLKNVPRYRWMEPESGDLACGVEGKGRLPEPTEIVSALEKMGANGDLRGKRVVVTAGPTREWIDPVRFLSNPSTGRMGYAIALAAHRRGAEVQLISGPTELNAPAGVAIEHVDTTGDMLNAVQATLKHADVLVMAAAPADLKPAQSADKKMRKNEVPDAIPLDRTPDILNTIRPSLNGTFVVGFAAETHDLEASARSKVTQKGVHLLFANRVSDGSGDTGFQSETNGGMLLDMEGTVIREIAICPKLDVANHILDEVVRRLSA